MNSYLDGLTASEIVRFRETIANTRKDRREMIDIMATDAVRFKHIVKLVSILQQIVAEAGAFIDDEECHFLRVTLCHHDLATVYNGTKLLMEETAIEMFKRHDAPNAPQPSAN